MIVILDNGHGVDTPGKRSPEWHRGVLYEWELNRDIVERIARQLNEDCIPYHILVSEAKDIGLMERAARANGLYLENKRTYLVSVHANAGGGTGWEVFTSKGQTKSDRIATVFYEQAKKFLTPFGFPLRTDYTDSDPDKEADFVVLKKTMCPAILTENLFMDTQRDYDFLTSEHGRRVIANIHIEAIKQLFYDEA